MTLAPKRVLFVQRHFWPDVPVYAHLAKEIALRLGADGHRVTVLSTMPTPKDAYSGPKPPKRENQGGLQIIRMRLRGERKSRVAFRLVDTGLFLGGVILHLARHPRRYELYVSTNAPPIFLTATIRWISRFGKAKYVYHCQDLQPEVGVLSGMIPRGWIERLLARIDYKNCASAEAVVVLSTDMADALLERGLDGSNVHILNNFSVHEPDEVHEVPSWLVRPPDVFRVLFAGNMGRFQGLDRIVEAAHLMAGDHGIQFLFVGSGVEVEALRSQAEDLVGSSVFFSPQQPGAVAQQLAADAQLGVIALRPGIIRLAYPSKTMAYLEAGCRLLLLVEPESTLAQLVLSHDLGVVCGSSDPLLIADSIRAEYERYRSHGLDRSRIHAVGKAHFDKTATLDKWSLLFTEMPAN